MPNRECIACVHPFPRLTQRTDWPNISAVWASTVKLSKSLTLKDKTLAADVVIRELVSAMNSLVTGILQRIFEIGVVFSIRTTTYPRFYRDLRPNSRWRVAGIKSALSSEFKSVCSEFVGFARLRPLWISRRGRKTGGVAPLWPEQDGRIRPAPGFDFALPLRAETPILLVGGSLFSKPELARPGGGRQWQRITNPAAHF